MDDMDKLAVRFHVGGEFYFDGNKMHYIGGSVVMSYIDRDLISLPEINDHLKDHGVVSGEVMLHLLYPGKNLDSGLRVLHDDKVCQEMSDCITGMGVADVFVESMAMQLEALADDERSDAEGNDIAAEMGERAVVVLNDGSSDEVEFIGERKSAAIQATNIKIEDSCQIIGEQSSSKVVEEDHETENTSESDYLRSGPPLASPAAGCCCRREGSRIRRRPSPK